MSGTMKSTLESVARKIGAASPYDGRNPYEPFLSAEFRRALRAYVFSHPDYLDLVEMRALIEIADALPEKE